jgi:hypothetical protein
MESKPQEGYWNGKKTQDIGERFQCRERIPIKDYAKFVKKLTFDKPGLLKLKLKTESINPEDPVGLAVSELILTKTGYYEYRGQSIGFGKREIDS